MTNGSLPPLRHASLIGFDNNTILWYSDFTTIYSLRNAFARRTAEVSESSP